jgi:lysophospholipase
MRCCLSKTLTLAAMHSFWLLPLLPFFVYAQSEGADPYAPLNATCPKDLAVRDAKSLSDEESKWRDGRLEKVHAALDTYLKNAQIPDFNITEYTEKLKTEDSPVVGLAISGGGTQSGVGGLGLWQAFDARYGNASDLLVATTNSC